MLSSKERRELEAHWTEERIARTAMLMKASVLLAVLVLLGWIGISVDNHGAAEAPLAAPAAEPWHPHAPGSAVAQSREVFEERRARWTEGEVSPASEIARR